MILSLGGGRRLSKLNLGYASLCFPNSSEKEKNTMKSFFHESST